MFRKLLVEFLAVSTMIGCGENPKDKNEIKNLNTISKYEVFQEKLLELHNKERTSKGYSKLEIDKNLCDYAQKHADKMAEKNWMYHSSMSDIRKVLDSNWVGENVAWGQETEESVVNSWMWSPGHRWNILGSNYKRVGFGMKKDKNNRKYWCVVFSD